MLLQYLTNFMKVSSLEKSGTVFTLFILFQLFNAFNSRELGSRSIFNKVGKNKVMIITFASIFFLHALIVTFVPSVFGVGRISIGAWIKCILISLSIIIVSEIYKLIFRILRVNNK